MAEKYITTENLSIKTSEWMKKIERCNVHKWPFHIGDAALLVIDMQRYFLEENAGGFLPAASAIIPNIQKLIEHFRKNKRPILFTHHAHNKDGSDTGILKKWWGDAEPVEGSPESEIIPGIKPAANDVIITKNRYSAFYNTRLEQTLKDLSIKEIVITGVMSNVCCESTTRDAFFRDYMVRFIADATATVSEEMHIATLLNLSYACADICTTDELIL